MKWFLAITVCFFSVQSGATDAFVDLQWGLKNQGRPQLIDLDPLFTYKVPARQNEDVQRPILPTKKEKVIVAVLDTGIQKNHPDLEKVIVRKDSECRALEKFKLCLEEFDRKKCESQWMNLNNPEVDLDRNGYPLDCQGWSLLGGVNAAGIMGRPDFGDEQGHGTHVAGIIAAERENNIGIQGLSENISLLPVQVIGVAPNEPIKPLSIYDSPFETGRESMKKTLGDLVARGVIYAMRSGARVINLSLGWPQSADSQLMRKVVEEAQARGVIVVAAAGNDSTRALLRPCSYPNVICVGASGPDGAPTHFSNYGGGVDLFAPGLNILSTYPEIKRPVRFRSTLGYEFLSGTSQAAPFVAATVAEMLAQGVPPQEIYPRLVLGSRPIRPSLTLIEGGAHQNGRTLSPDNYSPRKFAAGGNLDVRGSLEVRPQPLIMPVQKEKSEIRWDRTTNKLYWEIDLINKWSPEDTNQVRLSARLVKNHPLSIRPTVESFQEVTPYGVVWESQAVRKYLVTLRIDDEVDPARTRIPSDLDLELSVQVGAQEPQSYFLESEITVELNPNTHGQDIQVFPVLNMPKGRTNLIPVDQNFDRVPEKRDYFAVLEQGTSWQIWVVANEDSKSYVAKGGTRIQIEGESENLLDKISARIDLDGDQKSEYVLGVFEDKSGTEGFKGSPTHFYIFSDAMNLIDSFVYSGEMAAMPVDANQIFWQKVGNTKRPAWIGGGKDPNRRRGLRERWENPDNVESPQLRFYYLDQRNQLKALSEIEGYKIVDILQPNKEQMSAGTIPVLLAKNRGTESKPSYIYNFAFAEIYDGQVQNFQELDFFQEAKSYRNLLDTRVDRVFNLDLGTEEYSGTFWFGEGLNRQQRLSLLVHKNLEYRDFQLSAERSQFDSALRVRAAFAGTSRQGAFVLTNSEIQFHDILKGHVVSRSMERYSFFPDRLFVSLLLPLTLRDKTSPSAKLPALFNAETSGLSRGVKMFVPVFAKDGTLVELVSPARLRFKSSGCKPLDTPVFGGESKAHSFDYFCGDRLIRVHLEF